MTEEIKFEIAMERLEKIVEDLEAGNMDLDEALKKYEEGVRLSRACQKKLDEAEKKIEILTRTLDGALKKEPFAMEDGETGDGEAPSKRLRKTPGPGTPSEEEDLLF